ncbi:DUF1134 domain-containing protein [Sphingomonas endolithica]|uniref:DUF1134 domain-containing protein n=1 Tax=Sphingomonas endolithica TaxID=2972485 RepID=UPI0021B0556C|nr:DUF1134 domain-containing protein [Sphingomonas sp. ZFBP2030]
MHRLLSISVLTALLLGSSAGVAQDSIRTIDPNQAVDADLAPSDAQRARPPAQQAPTYPDYTPPRERPAPAAAPSTAQNDTQQEVARRGAETEAASGETFSRTELLSAAEATLGKGTSGLAGMLEKILKDQGEPNAYIAGREAGGAFVVGLRYGKGEMFHKIEGRQPVYWTGPSLGIDVGGDASKVFVLVYNLYDTEDLYRKRFAAGEGRLFFIGGVAATYLRMGDKVVIPIRLGVGWRQGVNVGYMKFSHTSKWFPF